MNSALLVLLAMSLPGVQSPDPQLAPKQLRLSYGDDPTRSIRVMWQTQKPTSSRVVHYGLTPELGLIAVGHQPTYPYETGALAEVTLANLRPGSRYYYKVGDRTGGWSETYSFQTAQVDPGMFTFTAFGDHGVSPDAVVNVQNVLFERPDFHVLLGDISYANGNQPIWDRYLEQIEPMTRTIPFMIALGNHENEHFKIDGKDTQMGYMSSAARFAMPGYEQWYAFDYGRTRFIACNSDDYENPTQIEWLEKTFAASRQDKRVEWLIVFNHHPAYGSSKGRGDNKQIIENLVPLFDKYKVDLVLSGHDHHYERQYPMREGKATSNNLTQYKQGEGTLYIIEGGGGRSNYDFIDPMPAICAHREKTNGYLEVSIKRRGSLVVEARRLDRSLIERVEISPVRR